MVCSKITTCETYACRKVDRIRQRCCGEERGHSMTLSDITEIATNKSRFVTIEDFVTFCERYLAFVSQGLQAVIVSQNEVNYHFYQYKEDGFFNITRPINSNLMYGGS